MKHIMTGLISAVLVAGLAFAAPGYAFTLKIATVAPRGTASWNEMKAGAEAIEERTDGRVALKFYAAGSMGSEAIVHSKIRSGQLHGGVFSSGGLADVYPDIQCLNLPMMFRDFDEVDYVRARMEPVMKRNLEQRGFVLLGVMESGFTRIISQQPMTNLEQVRNSKLWAPEGDEMVHAAYRSMDLAPVSLPVSDVYTGLQTGLLETATITPSLAIAFQWHKSTRYMTDTPLIYLVGLLAVKKKAFERISPSDQAVVREEITRVARRLDRTMRQDNRRALEALLNNGIEIVVPRAEEVARWRNLAERAVENMIEKGALTRAGVEAVRAHLRDYRARAQSAQ